MNQHKDWNPVLYLRFESERTRPALDLAQRIALDNPPSIADIGCGPGNSTQVLRNKWPRSKVVGIDNSSAMIEKAKSDYPDQEWLLADAAGVLPDKYDLIFSNAAIQWVPGQIKLLSDLLDAIHENGALAVQVPLYSSMPVSKVIESAGNQPRWKSKTNGCMDVLTFKDHGFYFDQLADKVKKLDIWETSYIHVMNKHQDILDMIKPTGMKPYLDRLESSGEKEDFEREVLSGIIKAYPAQKNGKVLFPFLRLFFIAYK